MIESLILGAVQGIAEWIPISSEAAIIFIKNTFFDSGLSLQELVKAALFLHLGTFFAALFYFWKEVKELVLGLFKFKQTSEENKKVITFLIVSTLLSSLIGFIFLKTISGLQTELELGSKFINILIAILLVFTAFIQIKSKRKTGLEKLRDAVDLKTSDGIFLGLVQGLSVMPGLSRSGLTVSTLLLRKFNETLSLKLSFLMSLPVVLLGNIALNLESFNLSISSLMGLLASFLFGLLTIEILFKISKRVNFAYFVLFFSALVFVSVFI